MKSGTIKKNGSISQLRSQQGFTVKFKLNTKRSPETVEEVDMGSESIIIRDINSLKEHLKEKYDGEVKDEHPVIEYYYLCANVIGLVYLLFLIDVKLEIAIKFIKHLYNEHL